MQQTENAPDLFSTPAPNNGFKSVILTQMVNGKRVERRYQGMSIQDAVKVFREELKKLVVLVCLAFITVAGHSQTTDPLTKNATYQKDTTIKSAAYKIYVGAKGGRFIIVTSKAGNQYKKYLKKVNL